MDFNNVGRNDPCPCGSGKKFKKCCGSIHHPKLPKLPKAELGLLRTFFRKFNKKELSATLGGLQLIPENDFHAVRLEIAADLAFSLNDSGYESIDLVNFDKSLNRYLPTISDIGIAEDPPENLFTENICFFGGNYTVYPSIYHEENIILENFFLVLNSDNNQLPINFIQETISCSLGILWISNEISKRLGHTRYLDCIHDYRSQRGNIYFPKEKEFNVYRNAVIFKKSELPFEIEILHPFIVNIGDAEKRDPVKNLLISPIIDFDNEIVIATPIALLCALRHYIIRTAIKFNVEKLFTELYRNALWLNSKKFLFLMNFNEINFLFPEVSDQLPIDEGIFQIDLDKIAFVQLVCDNANNYDISNPKSVQDVKSLIELIQTRDIEIIKQLKKEKSEFKEIFIIKIVGDIGRQSVVEYLNIENYRTLILSYETLKIISYSGDCDELILWKYVKANNDAFDFHRYISFSFLDKFSFYLKNHTLILDPKIIPNIVQIPIGYAKTIREKVAHRFDFHLAPLLDSDSILFVPVMNAYLDSKIPVYQLENLIAGFFGFEIEGYYQPIWIFYNNEIKNMTLEQFQIIKDFSNAIAYWFWQFTPGLKDCLKILGEKPIQIFYYLEDIENWTKYDEAFFIDNQGDPQVRYEIRDQDLIITFPKTIVAKIQGSDNSGDRFIIRQFFLGLAHLIESKSSSSLNEQKIDEMINEFAPLGFKKQIFLLFNRSEGLLIDNNLPEIRLLQDHDIQEQALGIETELKNKIPNYNLAQQNKSDLCKKIVEIYVKRLKSLLKNYNWFDLLNILVGNNDSILHTGKKLHLLAPYQIACYPQDSETIVKLMENFSRLEKSMLSVRILIEVIITEPPSGSTRANKDDIDKMLAIIHNLFDWATIGDLYYNKILKDELISGVAGRIYAPQLEEIGKKYTNFLHDKTVENIEGSYEFFKGEFDYKKKISTPKRDELSEMMENAFFAEFGLNSLEISRFFCCLIHSTELFICSEQKGPVYNLKYSDLVNRVKLQLNWTDDKVQNAIKQFSLKAKENGYNIDNEKPWKFRRDYSHVRRPLLIGSNEEDEPSVLWGSLHSERCLKYLEELVVEGRYDSSYASPEMQKLISTIQNIKGEVFTKFIKEWFERNADRENWFVEKNVDLPILLDKSQIEEKIGDIDVLAINKMKGIIYSIECKNLNFARNAREIAQEIIRFYEGTKNDSSWVSKHKKRDKWLKENINIVIKKYSLPEIQYQVKSIILTSAAIPVSYIHDFDPDIQIVSFSKIEREGIQSLDTI